MLNLGRPKPGDSDLAQERRPRNDLMCLDMRTEVGRRARWGLGSTPNLQDALMQTSSRARGAGGVPCSTFLGAWRRGADLQSVSSKSLILLGADQHGLGVLLIAWYD